MNNASTNNDITAKWPRKIFVTGIDTDAGKSYATGWLARRINENGGSAMTMKFVQTGNSGFSEDIAIHRRIMASTLQPPTGCISPHPRYSHIHAARNSPPV